MTIPKTGSASDMSREGAPKFHSVALFVVGVLIVGGLFTVTAGLIVNLGQERIKLHRELEQFHLQTLDTLIGSTKDAMLSFSPEDVRNIVSVLLKDERIVTIKIYSDIYDLYLLRVSKETKDRKFDTVSLRELVMEGSEVLGYVQVDVDKSWVLPKIKEERNRIIILFSAMFLGAMFLIIPTIYYKILKPLNRLLEQAEILSKGDLGVPYSWKGKDELSMLGRTLDDMRGKLNESFRVAREMAVTDELTGLPNRRGFYAEGQKLLHLSCRYKHPLAVSVFDLDFFKSINDTYGHAVGDEVLKDFSDKVSKRIRKTDLFARIGGEEFVLVMPETSIKAAVLLLDGLREIISSQEFSHGEKLTVSIGVAEYTGSEELNDIMDAADKALYRAKNEGRNRVVVHTASTLD